MRTTTLGHLDTLVARYPVLSGIRSEIMRAAEILCDSCKAGGKVMVCGNGGSAADSEHIVGELMKSFVLPRKPTKADVEKLRAGGCEDMAGRLQRGIAAISLVGHPSLATAVANDTDPAMIFAQQVYALGRPLDVVVGLSTSGNAGNVVNAIQVAGAFGMKTVGFTGCRPCALDSICDVTIKAPCSETYQVQEFHQPIYHALCLMIEEELFGAGADSREEEHGC